MASQSSQGRKVPTVFLGLWALVLGLMCGVMFLSVILGLACLVVGFISLFVEHWAMEMYIGGALVRTTMQKVLFTSAGAALCLVGFEFWRLHKRGFTVGAVALYAAFAVLVLALAWATGRSELISIVWATN